MRLGMKSRLSAPVESQMRLSFGMNPGATGSEPAAMIALAKRTTRRPSAVSTASVLALVNCASPVTTVTLRCLASPVSPPVNRLTTPSLNARSLSRSNDGLPQLTPCAPMCSASSITLATCSSALDGMQPTLRHTPPSVLYRSTSTTCLPEIGGAEGGGVAAGSGAEHQHVAFQIGLFRRGRRRRSGNRLALDRLGAAGGTSAHRCRRQAPPARRRSAKVASRSPWLTLSPTLTLISPITPASGAGTSSEALSLSSVSRISSLATLWPGFIRISITGTSLKSPMSGRRISLAITVSVRAARAACPRRCRRDAA